MGDPGSWTWDWGGGASLPAGKVSSTLYSIEMGTEPITHDSASCWGRGYWCISFDEEPKNKGGGQRRNIPASTCQAQSGDRVLLQCPHFLRPRDGVSGHPLSSSENPDWERKKEGGELGFGQRPKVPADWAGWAGPPPALERAPCRGIIDLLSRKSTLRAQGSHLNSLNNWPPPDLQLRFFHYRHPRVRSYLPLLLPPGLGTKKDGQDKHAWIFSWSVVPSRPRTWVWNR